MVGRKSFRAASVLAPYVGVALYLGSGIVQAQGRDSCISREPIKSVRAHHCLNLQLALTDEKGAVEDYDKAIRQNPYSAQAYLNRAKAYLNMGAIDKAIADYDKVIGMDPRNAFSYYGRGVAYQLKGEGFQKRAIADFAEAVRIKPDYFDALIRLGAIYKIRRDYDLIIENSTKLIKLDARQQQLFRRTWLCLSRKRRVGSCVGRFH